MSTNIRPEISEKSEYWIDRHRYYELKHFCLQYPIWKRNYAALLLQGAKNPIVISQSKTQFDREYVSKCVEERLFYSKKIEMIESVAKETDLIISSYILKAVTEGLTYDALKARFNIPCCKGTYYNLYRKFFWILSQKRR